MVAICFVKQRNNVRIQVDYIISEFILRNNFRECSMCKSKTQKIYSMEVFKNSNLVEHYLYCKKCFEDQVRFLKQDIYNTNWNTLIFLINNYGFVIERTNLLRERCDFCYELYIRFKVKLYPIALENKLCIRCFKDKLEQIIFDFERNIFII
jgi:hypothetical protein